MSKSTTVRAEQIARARSACAELIDAAGLAFSAAHWGGDNGCKQLLVDVRERATALNPVLFAAQILDGEPHSYVVGDARNVCRVCGRLKEDHGEAL